MSSERIALALILVFAGALRAWFGVGLAFTDDFLYVDLALDASENRWAHYFANATHFASTRVGIIGPLGSVLRVLPATERTIAITPFLLSMGTVWCAYALGAVQHNARAGLIAAAFAACIPIDVWFATAILPDSFVPFYTGAALLALAASGVSQTPVKSVLWAAVSGVMVFLAFESRPTSGILLVPIGLTALLSKERRLIRMCVPPLAFVAIVVGYWLVLRATSGNFLLQIEHFTKDATGTRWTGTGKPFEHLQTMLPVLRILTSGFAIDGTGWVAWTQAIHTRVMELRFGPLYYVAWPAVIFACIRARSDARFRLPVIAFLTLYLFFEFGSTSPTSYVPIWKLPRFLTILTVPVCVTVGLVIDFLLENHPQRVRLVRAGLAITLALTLLSLFVATPLFNLRDNNAMYRSTFAEIRSLRLDDRVYVPGLQWRRRASVFLRLAPSSNPQINELKGVALEGLGTSTVIIDTAYLQDPEKGEERRAEIDPALLEIPDSLPAGWRTLLVTANMTSAGASAPVYVLRTP